MNLAELLLPRAVTFALASARLAGFVITSPFPGAQVPQASRIGLVAVLAWVVASSADGPAAAAPSFGLGLFGWGAAELAIGLSIGLVFRFLMAAADVLGDVLSKAIGLGTASLLNPALGEQDTTMTLLVTSGAMLLALSIGAHRVALAYLLESFRVLPTGSAIGLPAATPVFLELASRSLTMGVRLCMPVLAISLTVQITLALLARASPTLQIFSIGFTLMIATGLLTFMSSLPAVGQGLADHLGGLGEALNRLLVEIGSF
jgi:flagellar biosynthesis protein FliR